MKDYEQAWSQKYGNSLCIEITKFDLRHNKIQNTNDMNIDKLLQYCISKYGLLLYFSFIQIWNFQDFLVCLWTFKWVGGPFVGDFGCAVFIVESTNPKNLD